MGALKQKVSFSVDDEAVLFQVCPADAQGTHAAGARAMRQLAHLHSPRVKGGCAK